MRMFRKITSLFLAAVLSVSLAAPAGAAETASAIRLSKTEGTVAVTNAASRSMSVREKMLLHSGYRVSTQAKSYAWLQLGQDRLSKLDASSEVEVRKSGKQLELLLKSGNISFNVSEPLKEDETLNIRTSTMAMGIRGTCGWVQVVDQVTTRVYILEGTVACTATDPATGQKKSVIITAGQSAEIAVTPGEDDIVRCEIDQEAVTEEDVPGYVLVDLVDDPQLCDLIYDASGIDLREVTAEEAQEKQDQEQASWDLVIQEVQQSEAEQENNVSQEPVWESSPPAADNSSDSGSSGSDSSPSTAYTVTFDANGGTFEDGSATKTVTVSSSGEVYDLSTKAPTLSTAPSGKVFVGWGLTSDANTAETSVTVVGDVTLYAVWYTELSATTTIADLNTALESGNVKITAESSATLSLDRDNTLSIPASSTLIIGSGVTVENTGGTIEVKGTMTVEGNLTNSSGTVSIPSGGTLTVEGTLTNGGTITVNGTMNTLGAVTNNGTIEVNSPNTLNVGGAFTNNRNGMLNVTSTGRVVVDANGSITNNGGTIQVSGTMTVEGTLTNSGTVSIPSDGTLTTKGGLTNSDTGSIAVSGTMTTSGAVTNNGTISVDSLDALNVNGRFTNYALLQILSAGGVVVGTNGNIINASIVDDTNVSGDSVGGILIEEGGQLDLTKVTNKGWILDNDALHLGEEGAASIGTSNSIPWSEYTEKITSVTFDSGVTSIGNGVLADCSNLTTVTIPAGVTTIGESAFSGCESLTSVTITGEGPMSNYTSSNSSPWPNLWVSDSTEGIHLTIGEEITHIGNYAFSGCESLSSVSLPADITSIGTDAFTGCSALESVTITGEGAMRDYDNSSNSSPWYDLLQSGSEEGIHLTIGEGITSIGAYAFHGDVTKGNRLTEVAIPEGVTSIGDHAFYWCNRLAGEMAIPDSVTSIGVGAFQYCRSLPGVTIPSGIKTIEDKVFYGCSSLESVTIPNSVETIGEDAFASCEALTEVTIPNSVETIGDYAFKGCSKLTSLTIPAGVTEIGQGVFWGCTALTGATIPGSVKAISSNMFVNCEALTEVTILDGVTTINSTAFQSCKKLASISIPASVTKIGDNAFERCTTLTSVTFAEGSQLTTINQYAFWLCEALTDMTIPAGVTEIGQGVFKGCAGLTSVTLPAGVTEIGQSVFNGCTGLTSLTLPASITSIGTDAFFGCEALKTITYLGTMDTWNNFPADSLTALSALQGATVIISSVDESGEMTSSGSYLISSDGKLPNRI